MNKERLAEIAGYKKHRWVTENSIPLQGYIKDTLIIQTRYWRPDESIEQAIEVLLEFFKQTVHTLNVNAWQVQLDKMLIECKTPQELANEICNIVLEPPMLETPVINMNPNETIALTLGYMEQKHEWVSPEWHTVELPDWENNKNLWIEGSEAVKYMEKNDLVYDFWKCLHVDKDSVYMSDSQVTFLPALNYAQTFCKMLKNIQNRKE